VTRRKYRGAKRVDTPSTFEDEAFTRLTEKLYRWLFLQPEWVHVLASDRHVRRVFAAAIADAVTKVPPYVSSPPPQPKRLTLRVSSGEDKPNRQGGVETLVGSHAPGDTPQPDPEGDVKAQMEAANDAYMDRLEAEEAARE